ncbi:MAG TPA: S-methyl-5-thioribose-1-phosphate isomerase [Candidatus Hydrogenedentes bacterium]|nr:S-methyl-5-thioribose-1-phosphate isomerase [Candidatus Hydrogenedentota bacterium]HIJ73424.1 S-methyl-5-thioribose-1-phosphate isomerase [Candidatus Hydrogenedentota bacterium]
MPADTVTWRDNALTIIDQTLLPTEYRKIRLARVADVWHAIKTLKIRGAPAIGVCAAFGVLVAVKEKAPNNTVDAVRAAIQAADYLATSRPTAVNLFWALSRMKRVADSCRDAQDPQAVWQALEAEAKTICDEDRQMCRAIGNHGAGLIHDGDGVLTHCNAGGLATSDYGTALAVMFRAHEIGRRFHVFADETRPLLQGARLTAWELVEAGIDATVICDNMAAQVMREGRIQLVIVGADRIAANGDTANKIGTYGVALLAKAHNIPFYVAAPSSTFDLSIESGEAIPIEQRDPAEVTHGFGRQTAPAGVGVYNPAFDVTPAELVTAFITEKGLLRPPYRKEIAAQS